MSARVILHLDCDCFYAQVEHERLGIPRDVPLAVQQWDGLIAVNYAARAAGVKRGMPTQTARELCSSIVLVHVNTTTGEPGMEGTLDRQTAKADLGRYREASRRMFEVLEAAYDSGIVVEKAGLDEAYIDCTDVCAAELEARGGVIYELPADTVVAEACEADALLGAAEHLHLDGDSLLRAGCLVAERLRAALRTALRFTASCGIAQNKMLAKQASTLNKPNRQTLVPAAASGALLRGIRLKDVRGLGGKLGDAVSALLDELGARAGPTHAAPLPAGSRYEGCKWTVGDVLERLPPKLLAARLGTGGAQCVLDKCAGVDDARVEAKGPPKSLMEMKSAMLRATAEAAAWVRTLAGTLDARVAADSASHARHPRTLSLTFGPLREPTHSRQGPYPPHGAANLAERVQTAALGLLRECEERGGLTYPITRLALQASNFQGLERGSRDIAALFTHMGKAAGSQPASPAAAPSPAQRRPPGAEHAACAAGAEHEWACARCTFLFAASAPRCAMCGAERPGAQAAGGLLDPAAATARPAQGPQGGAGSAARTPTRKADLGAAGAERPWSCVACTFACGAAERTCTMCGALRGSSLAATQQLRALKRARDEPPPKAGLSTDWHAR